MYDSSINTSYFLSVQLVVGANQTVPIPTANITSLVIRESALEMIPTFSMSLNDTGGLMETLPMYAGDRFIIGIGKHSEAPDIVWYRMMISNYTMKPTHMGKNSELSIVGFLQCTNLTHPIYNKTYPGTSVSVLTEVIQSMGHKVVSEIDTNDSMIWYQIGHNHQFMKHLVDRSYINNDVMFCTFDPYTYKFRIKSLEQAYNANPIYIAKYDINKTNLYLLDDESNELFFKSFSISNLTGHMASTGAFRTAVSYFDMSNRKVMTSDIDMPMKMTTYLNTTKSDIDLKDSSKFELNVGNAYLNYPYACMFNRLVKKNMYTNTIDLMVNPLNKLKILDTIDVDMPSIYSGSTDVNTVWSGKYIVVSINHLIVGGGEYNKTITVARNGMNGTSVRKEMNIK